MSIVIHLAITFDGRMRRAITVPASRWNMKHLRRLWLTIRRAFGWYCPMSAIVSGRYRSAYTKSDMTSSRIWGHIAMRPLTGHHPLQANPQIRQIAKCRLPELNLVHYVILINHLVQNIKILVHLHQLTFGSLLDILCCADGLSSTC